MTPRQHATANPTNDAQRANIARDAAKAADAKIRATPGEHANSTAYRWNQCYWAEWGERMEAAGLRPWWERGRPPQAPVSEHEIRADALRRMAA